MAHKPATSAAAAFAAVLLASCLLLPTHAACPPGKTPVHCKAKGERCTLRTISECEKPNKCQDGYCGGKPPDRGSSDKVTPQPEPEPRTPEPSTGGCVLPVSPFEVRTGTPADHKSRHPEDTNYKNINAVDLMVKNAGQAVYAVENGQLSTGSSFVNRNNGASVYGRQFEIITPSRNFFYTHLAEPLATSPTTGQPWGPGETVKKGQLLGWVGEPPEPTEPGKKKGPTHLHFATNTGNPCEYLRGCTGVNGMGPDSTLSKC